jgi:phosphoglycerate dehydrogenase-like enzyme
MMLRNGEQPRPCQQPRANSAGPSVITFLDRDHVLRACHALLDDRRSHARDWLLQFFASCSVDSADLDHVGRGLHPADGVETRWASDRGEQIAGSSVLVLRRGVVTDEMMGLCPELRLIQRLGRRTDAIDLAGARARGVPVSCLERRSLVLVAEHVLMFALALGKRLIEGDRAVRTGAGADGGDPGEDPVRYNWANLGDLWGLDGKTLGILGMGEVGQLVAARAVSFGLTVRYHSRRRLAAQAERTLGAEYVSRSVLFADSDIVSLHVQGTAENDFAVGAAELALMRPGAVLINTARGNLVDEEALYDALIRRRIAGAALDVHAIEPRPVGRLSGLDNVLLSPHIAGGTRHEVLVELSQMCDNIRAALAGAAPRFGRVG